MLKIPEFPFRMGLPAKYKNWRSSQPKAIQEILSMPKQTFLTQVQPTGSGKSLTYVAAAKLAGYQTVILTSTKILQEQIIRDFAGIGVKSIMGQSNYPCIMDTRTSCAEGICHVGINCELKKGGCTYFDALREARESKIYVTNYAYWLIGGLSEGVDLLVLDESHHAPFIVMDYMTITFKPKEYAEIFGQDIPFLGDDVKEWKLQALHFLELALMLKDKAKFMLEMEPQNKLGKELAYRSLIAERLFTAISKMEGKWIGEESNGVYTLMPIQTSKEICHKFLFKGIPRVLLTSATVNRKTLQMLFIPENDGVNKESASIYSEYPSTFPVSIRKVIHLKTCPVTFRTPLKDLLTTWMSRIDKIISCHSARGEKGIIHTGSHSRKDFICTHSVHKNLLFHNTSENTRKVIESFKRTNMPAVLVSPSVTTGQDFPLDECRYQIVCKVPFPDTRGRLWTERKKFDPQLADYITMQTFQQECGRGTRSEIDYCITYVVDDSILWWFIKNKNLAQDWFKESVFLNVVMQEFMTDKEWQKSNVVNPAVAFRQNRKKMENSQRKEMELSTKPVKKKFSLAKLLAQREKV